MTDRVVIGGDLKLHQVIDGDLTLHQVIDGECDKFMPVFPEGYSGSYIVTPSEEVQTIPMAGYMAAQNVTIEAIPSNYGRIVYNGTSITIL